MKKTHLVNLGAFDDFPSVLSALDGVWGVWNNTDDFTVGEAKEVFAGIRIFELSKQVKTVRHYVWSNLDYSFKVSGIAIGCATYTEHTEVERGIQACLQGRALRWEGSCCRVDADPTVRRQ